MNDQGARAEANLEGRPRHRQDLHQKTWQRLSNCGGPKMPMALSAMPGGEIRDRKYLRQRLDTMRYFADTVGARMIICCVIHTMECTKCYPCILMCIVMKLGRLSRLQSMCPFAVARLVLPNLQEQLP